MNINKLTDALKRGISRPNKYEVSITPPAWLLNSAGVRDLTVLCDTVIWPGTQIASLEDKIWGPIRKMPYLNTFEDLRFSFVCADNMNIRHLFDDWQWSVVYRDNHKINYYENYAMNTSVTVTILDEKGDPIHRITAHEAYPIDVVSQPLSYAENDSYLRVEVNMAYRYWEDDLTVGV